MNKSVWKRHLLLVSLAAALVIGVLGVRLMTATPAHAMIVDGGGCVQTNGAATPPPGTASHGNPVIWHTSICVSGGPSTYYLRGNCWVDQVYIPDAFTNYQVQCNLYHWVNGGWTGGWAFNYSQECVWIKGVEDSCGSGHGAGASSYQYSTTANQLWEVDFQPYNGASEVVPDFGSGIQGAWYYPSSGVPTQVDI